LEGSTGIVEARSEATKLLKTGFAKSGEKKGQEKEI
jgi:hypothetical protein